MFANSRGLNFITSIIIPCARKKLGKKLCDFELMAFRPTGSESGYIHVYAFGQHNHSFMPESKR
jgi:hypothetical protein